MPVEQTADFSLISGRIARWINILTAACWPAAFAVFLLHVTNHVFLTSRSFDETACWLVAVGCLGCPAFALRLLGRWTTPRICLGIGLAAAGASVLLSALDIGRQINPGPSNRLIGLVLLLAIAIQSVNGAEQMISRERAVAALKREYADAVVRARREHRESCVLTPLQRERARADLLDALAASPGEAELLYSELGRRLQMNGARGSIVPFGRAGGRERN